MIDNHTEADKPSFALGLDIGGSSAKLGLFKATGQLVDKAIVPMRGEPEAVIETLITATRAILANNTITAKSLLGLGLAVCGVVDSSGAVSMATNTKLDFDLLKRRLSYELFDTEDSCSAVPLAGLEEHYEGSSIAVRLLNDANAAALGEAWQGSGQACTSLVTLTLGTGIGAGILLDGKLVVGVHGTAGEMGHFCVNPDEEESCNCGKRGCLEHYASGTGLVRQARRVLKALHDRPSIASQLATNCGHQRLRAEAEPSLDAVSDEASVLEKTLLVDTPALEAKDIFDAALAGDILAQQMVDEFSHILGFALSQISCMFDPEIIILGGGLSLSSAAYIESVRHYYETHAFKGCRGTVIVPAKLGSEAGMYGAAYYLLTGAGQATD